MFVVSVFMFVIALLVAVAGVVQLVNGENGWPLIGAAASIGFFAWVVLWMLDIRDLLKETRDTLKIIEKRR